MRSEKRVNNRRRYPAKSVKRQNRDNNQGIESQGPNPGEPKVNKHAAKLLKNIGRPDSAPFVPDPFQIEALESVLEQDVLVSAPTGSGKTWIALEAAKRLLAKGYRLWYATPLKALSNSKLEEFGKALGEGNVGILTGDRKENPDAPVIVGTTEILRNQLYDAMRQGEDIPFDLVILDEAHYLGDADRGVVWEEVLIYLPQRVRLLLLSATISNHKHIAAWLSTIRESRCKVVYSEDRPVPLKALFLTHERELTPLFSGKKLFQIPARYAYAQKKTKRRFRSEKPKLNEIVECMREFNLLPAIVFLKSRSDCDKALESLPPTDKTPREDGFEDVVKELAGSELNLADQRQTDKLMISRAGSHHAGQLPAWRLLVEKLMSMGYLDVIFSTSTVAAGVNFPARTVVLLQSDRFNGSQFVDMTATDIHQMTGRAGRRGMDNVGFALILPERHMKLDLVKDLLLSKPEPLQSRIHINFSMTLNLLLSHTPSDVHKLLGMSLAAFHEIEKKAEKAHRKLVKDFKRHMNLLIELDYLAPDATPTNDGIWAAKLRLDHPLLIAELIREGEFNDLDPQELACLIAPFVVDKDREVVFSRQLWIDTRYVWKRFRSMMQSLKPLMGFMASRGFDTPMVMFWPAAAAYMWASDVEWTELKHHVDADEGDMAMMLLRTADHLRQLAALEEENPELAANARRAISMIMRPPLI